MYSPSNLPFHAAISSSVTNTSITVLILGVTYALYTREFTPLRNIPGPFVASLTRFWIFQKQRGCQRQQVDIDLRRKYGPIVRISPNEVMVSSPKALKIIYGAGSKFPKGDWYQATSDCGWRGPDELGFLPEMNTEKYRIQRRVTGQAYTENAMKDIEGNMNTILEKSIGIMRGREGQSTDVDVFFNLFAADCLAMSTFSIGKGAVEAGKDDGSVGAIHNAWKYMHLVGFFPWIHRLNTWFVNYIVAGWTSKIKVITNHVPRISSLRSREPQEDDIIFGWALKQLKARVELKDKISEAKPAADIAGKLLQIHAEKPTLKIHWLRNMILTNFGAGVETIGITVSTLVCYILDSPGCQKKIQAEIDAALKSGKMGKIPKLRDLEEHLPFLNACLRESMRLHPVIGMPLPRVVPGGGVELEGHFLPAGTTVGINPWVLSRDKSLYGEDADDWRPERWLEYSSTRLRYLETYNFFFGKGLRSCPGKHLAQAIYTKMTPMLFMNFDWSYVDPNAEKKIRSTFSTRLVDVMVQWRTREGVEV